MQANTPASRYRIRPALSALVSLSQTLSTIILSAYPYPASRQKCDGGEILATRDYVGTPIGSVRPTRPVPTYVGRRSYVHGVQTPSCGSEGVNTASITSYIFYFALSHMTMSVTLEECTTPP